MTDKFEEACHNVILNAPFFGALNARLAKIPDTSIDTLCTDGVSLWYNPNYIDSITFAQTVGAIIHDIHHPALGHHARRGNRDPHEWNICADLAINPGIIKAGYELPPGALIDWAYEGKSAEEIYTIRAAKRSTEPSGKQNVGQEGSDASTDQNSPQSRAKDCGGTGSFIDAPAMSQPEMEEQAQDWEIAAMQAASAAKAAGQLSGAASYIVTQIKAPKTDWRELLRNFMTVSTKETSWLPPNRRFVYHGIYLPGSHDKKQMGDMVIVMDTSGSIWANKQLLDDFASEINGILEDTAPETTHVIYWDICCKGHDTFERDDLPITVKPRGGGRTAFDNVWQWLADNDIDPSCVVVLTDLYASIGAEPDYPVLWATVASVNAAWGEVVKLELDH